MSSRYRKRKRASSVEEETSRQESKISEEDDTSQESQGVRPSRNRRKSAKLTEAEETMKYPSSEPQRVNVISLHHTKGGRKDSEDSWTITSSGKQRSKTGRSESDHEEEMEGGQLLHVVSKGKRQQTIKIKPLHKPEPSEEEQLPPEKPSSKHGKKSHQRSLPPIAIKEDSSVSVKEESGIKLKLILSPKDRPKSEMDTSKGLQDKRSTSKDKSNRSAKNKEDRVLRLDGNKAESSAQSKKGKRVEVETQKASSSPDPSKGNKKRKSSSEVQKMPQTAGKPTEAKKSVAKASTKPSPSVKGSSKTAQKTLNKMVQTSKDNKSKTKTKPSEEASKTSSNTSKVEDKSKKKSKSSKASTSLNVLPVDEPLSDLVIDETKLTDSPKKTKASKPDKKKKKSSSLMDSASHKSKKHKNKEIKKQKAKFISTGTKKPGHSVGLDPITASHMFGQFDTLHSRPQPNLSLKETPSLGLDDESFFMAGSNAAAPSLSPDADLMGLSGLGSLSSVNRIKKPAKKSSKKSDRDKKKKKKKDKLKKGVIKEKKPLTAYMLWCGQTRRSVVAQNPGLDFSGISRMMGTLWQQLPEKEKLTWYNKQRLQSIKHKNVPSLSKQKLKRSNSASRGSRSPRGSPVRFVARSEPIDCAAHLKLLGESLSLVGDRLQNHVGQVEIHGSLSVLLDSTLCALAPLVSLTSQVPQLNSIKKETISSTLDNIAYIMPGLG